MKKNYLIYLLLFSFIGCSIFDNHQHSASGTRFTDFDIFTLRLIDSLDNSIDRYPYFVKSFEDSTVFIVNYYSSMGIENIRIPKGTNQIETLNTAGGEADQHVFIQRLDSNRFCRYDYDMHPNTFNRTFYQNRGGLPPLLHMIIPNSIRIITQDTLYYYSLMTDEQFYPYEGNSEVSGINKTIDLDSIQTYRVLPFSLNLDTLLADKNPSITDKNNENYLYNKYETHKVWREFHDLFQL
jgi:hypothetical protein